MTKKERNDRVHRDFQKELNTIRALRVKKGSIVEWNGNRFRVVHIATSLRDHAYPRHPYECSALYVEPISTGGGPRWRRTDGMGKVLM